MSSCCQLCLVLFQVFGVGGLQASLKSFQRKDSLLIFPHIQSIKLTQTQVSISIFVYAFGKAMHDGK